jgi:predicted Ser/Thr protein kinase
MGTVYLGRQGDRTAAVKAIAPALAGSPDFRARFRREIDICRRVHGAQVAELLDADPDAPQPWLAVRYVPGPTLDRAVHAHGPLTGPTLDGFALAVAEALRQLHAAGVTHRDLKPSNVILTAETPVLIDFGIAGAADATSLTATGTSMGSAGWMAPEQILGNPTGPATDVFAWGALVAFASTGQPPFGVGRPESLTYRVVHGTPDLDQVPGQYRSIVARALTVDPAARPTVAHLIAELSDDPAATQVTAAIAATWVGDDATRFATTIAEPPLAELPPAAERRWRVPAFVAAVVAVMAIGAAALYVGTRQDPSSDVAAGGTATTQPVSSTTVSTTTTAATTTAAAPTTTAPPTTTAVATTVPAVPEYTETITPLTTDIDDLLNFASEHTQEVVALDLAFDGAGDTADLKVEPDYSPEQAYIFVCSEHDPADALTCWGGSEIMITDLATTPDASLAFEHGQWRLRGRFAVQGISGPFQGIMGLGLRAVPIS